MPPGIVRLSVDRDSGLRVQGNPSNSADGVFFGESLPDWGNNASEPIDTETLEGIF
jgi:hypothetical protein